MTIVAGFISPSDWGYIASDSSAVSDDLYSVARNAKVAHFGKTLVGFAGSFREGKKAFEQLERMTSGSLVVQFERTWRKENFTETQFLFLESKRIYEIGQDGAVIELADRYGAIGTGTAVALGALGRQAITKECLTSALTIVSHHVPEIRGPWQLEEVLWV